MPTNSPLRSPFPPRSINQPPNSQYSGEFELVDPSFILKSLGGIFAVALILAYITLCVTFARSQWQLVLHPSREITRQPDSYGLNFVGPTADTNYIAERRVETRIELSGDHPWLVLPNVKAISLSGGHTFAPKAEHIIEASGEYACPVCAPWYTTDDRAVDLPLHMQAWQDEAREGVR